MVLTNFPHDPILDLDPWVGQRSASYRFALTNAVTNEHLGDIHPIRTARLIHDTSRVIKRTLNLDLGTADQAAINQITDRVSVFMVFPGGTEYPLGRYMFTDNTRQKFTSGDLGTPALNDEMFLVDQPITAGLNGMGPAVSKVIQLVLTGLPIQYSVAANPFSCAEAWGSGTFRGTILQALALSGDYFDPWFDNDNVLRFIRTFNPVDSIPDFNWDAGNQVMRQNIVENDDILTAPNTFVVISNTPGGSDEEVVGRASVPDSAPHSFVNRGFEIARVENLQLSSSAQAQSVAVGLVNKQSIFERVAVNTAPDPRFDSYNVVHWQGSNWLSLAWSLNLVEGSPMAHLLRRSYGE